MYDLLIHGVLPDEADYLDNEEKVELQGAAKPEPQNKIVNSKNHITPTQDQSFIMKCMGEMTIMAHSEDKVKVFLSSQISDTQHLKQPPSSVSQIATSGKCGPLKPVAALHDTGEV